MHIYRLTRILPTFGVGYGDKEIYVSCSPSTTDTCAYASGRHQYVIVSSICLCGYVDMWICGYVDMWICGYVDVCMCVCADV
jgi:hypothetical protein